MSADSALRVNDAVSIPRFELTFRATRAGGPGGQHVNTSSTRVELLWNVERSSALSEDQRSRLRQKLAARLDAEGNVRIVASTSRSQTRNRVDAEERLVAILGQALRVPKARKPTKPTRAGVEKRLREKKLASQRKQQRRRSVSDE